jgi:CRISPR/Cas system-associated exonuclease Cas4 (RecB family)
MASSLNLESLLDDYIAKKRVKDTRHTTFASNEYFISSAGGCLYRRQLERLVPRQPSSATLRRFEIGNIVHRYIQDCILDSVPGKAEIEKEVIFEHVIADTTLKFHGWADIVLDDCVLEIKSITDINRVKGFSNEVLPKFSNVQQLLLYMFGLRKSAGYILYVQSDNLKTLQHYQEFDAKIVKQTMSEFYLLNICEQKSLSAPRSVGEGCLSCLYSMECLSGKEIQGVNLL